MRDIVTGVQSPEAAVRVLERALSESETSHQPLRVVTAWSSPPIYGDMAGVGYAGSYLAPAESSRGAKALVEGLLDKALHERHSELPVVATTEDHAGDPGRVLVQASEDAALVVVGGRSHGAIAAALLGSATGYVAHHARCPVMVVPACAAPGPFLRVIVGVDGEGSSRAALHWGLDAAARHHCPLVVVHATNVLPIPGVSTVYPDYEVAARAWVQDEIDSTLPDHRDVSVTCEIIEGQAARVLLAKAGPDDLLVIGSRGRGGFLDLVLGSVTTQCTGHARGAVVIVREGQERLAS